VTFDPRWTACLALATCVVTGAAGWAQSDDGDGRTQAIIDALNDPDPALLTNTPAEPQVIYAVVDATPSPDAFCAAVAEVAPTLAGQTGASCLDDVVPDAPTVLIGGDLDAAIAWADSVGVVIAFPAPTTTAPNAATPPGDKPEAHCVGARPPAPFR